MNSVQSLVSDLGGRAPMPRQPLASWYTQGAADGLGDRLLMFDNTTAGSLELLRFRPQFSAAPGFERALRERVERLESFNHPAFSQARAVERLDGDEGLALVSTHTPGKRLSEMFQGPQVRAGTHPAFVVWLIRQVTTALTDLHAQGAGMAHGALAAERIVLTPDGQLVILEHVLGSALDDLQLPAHRLWHDLGIVTLPGPDGSSPLDARNDIVQLGLMALSVLLGRRITPEEYPERLSFLLDEFSEGAGQRSPSLVLPLRQWLTRALQLQDCGFGSALEANDSLGDLPELFGPQAIEHFRTSHPRAIRSLLEPSMSDTPVRALVRPVPAGDPPANRPWRLPEADLMNIEVPAAWVRDEAAPAIVPAPARPVQKIPQPPDRPSPAYRRFLTARSLAAALGVVSLAEAAAIGGLLMTRPSESATSARIPAAAAASIPLLIESPASGDLVMVDGREVGVTPFQLTVGSSTRAIRIVSQAPPVPALVPPVKDDARAKADVDAPALAAAAARPLSGGLRLSSPIELQVLEGERVLGSSTGPIVISAGVHQLDLINSALGYRSRQTVQIKAGQIVPLRVQPPDGRLSINALPWAQVWIDGNPVGETPLANLSVAVGEHEIIFRHPQLGERRETTIVKSDTLTRVSATFGR